MTEILFNNQNIAQRRKRNYLRIQRFKKLIHWFHFHSERDVSHVLTVESLSSIRLPNFFVNESLPHFGDRNNVAFFIGKILHQTPIKRLDFSDCSRFRNPKSFPQQQSKHSATPLTTKNLYGHVTSRNYGLSSNDQGRQRRESLTKRGSRLLDSSHNLPPGKIA